MSDLSTRSACMGNGRMGNGIAGNGNEFLALYNHSYKVQELGNREWETGEWNQFLVQYICCIGIST